MDIVDQYKKLNAAIEASDYRTVESLVHDEYQLVGVGDRPFGKKDLLRMIMAFKTGVPDLVFNFTDLRQQGEEVVGKQRITGTHTGTLDLSFIGLPAQPATGARVALPEEPVSASFRDGKLYRERVETVPGGGLEGLLRQLGVAVPAEI